MNTARIITALEVAKLLGCSQATFRTKRRALERDCGFPAKMPGCNGWSKPAVCRWIETNGQTYLPAAGNDTAALDRAARALAAEYDRGAA